jgi:hypothetical protein
MTGIYYEKQPDGSLRRELYASLTAFVAEVKGKQAQQDSAALKDSDFFYLLIFLYRMGLLRTNGRLRSRRYIEFLRSQFPEVQKLKRVPKRISCVNEVQERNYTDFALAMILSIALVAAIASGTETWGFKRFTS